MVYNNNKTAAHVIKYLDKIIPLFLSVLYIKSLLTAKIIRGWIAENEKHVLICHTMWWQNLMLV